MTIDDAWEHDVRRRFFALGPDACRFGVTAGALANHLAAARRRLAAPAADPQRLHLADLALACAVCARNAGAWQELIAAHEQVMIHCAQAHVAEVEALVVVRRLLAHVREQSCGDEGGALSLRRYLGTTPLRAWLLDRLVVMIYRQRPAAPAGVTVERGLSAVGRLRLGARFVQVDGMPVQQAARIVGLRERDVRRAAARRLDRAQLLRDLPRQEPAESGTGPVT